jgi:hypothetical protein
LLDFPQFRVFQEHVKSFCHDFETSRGSSASQTGQNPKASRPARRAELGLTARG